MLISLWQWVQDVDMGEVNELYPEQYYLARIAEVAQVLAARGISVHKHYVLFDNGRAYASVHVPLGMPTKARDILEQELE